MPYRRPTRFLAPIALVAAIVAVYVVAKPEVEQLRGKTTATQAPATGTTGAKKKRHSSKSAKTYTVKPGDTLGGIAEKTGVSMTDLEDFNNIDAENLDVGEKLKLHK